MSCLTVLPISLFLILKILLKMLHTFRSQFITFTNHLNYQLADGRAFLFGEKAEWADVNAYMNIWMARGNIPSS